MLFFHYYHGAFTVVFTHFRSSAILPCGTLTQAIWISETGIQPQLSLQLVPQNHQWWHTLPWISLADEEFPSSGIGPLWYFCKLNQHCKSTGPHSVTFSRYLTYLICEVIWNVRMQCASKGANAFSSSNKVTSWVKISLGQQEYVTLLCIRRYNNTKAHFQGSRLTVHFRRQNILSRGCFLFYLQPAKTWFSCKRNNCVR